MLLPGSHFKPINSESLEEEPKYWNFFEAPLGDLDSECLRTVCLSRGLIFREYQMSAEMGLRRSAETGSWRGHGKPQYGNMTSFFKMGGSKGFE